MRQETFRSLLFHESRMNRLPKFFCLNKRGDMNFRKTIDRVLCQVGWSIVMYVASQAQTHQNFGSACLQQHCFQQIQQTTFIVTWTGSSRSNSLILLLRSSEILPKFKLALI
jgi:hypothetical protein